MECFKLCLLNFTCNFISGGQIATIAEMIEIAEVGLSPNQRYLTHLFPMRIFSTPLKTLRFSDVFGGRERVHWEQLG